MTDVVSASLPLNRADRRKGAKGKPSATATAGAIKSGSLMDPRKAIEARLSPKVKPRAIRRREAKLKALGLG